MYPIVYDRAVVAAGVVVLPLAREGCSEWWGLSQQSLFLLDFGPQAARVVQFVKREWILLSVCS